MERGSVGFVVRRLEDARHARSRRDVFEGSGHLEGVAFALDHARTENEGEGMTGADCDAAGRGRRDPLHHARVVASSVLPLTASFWRCDAPTKLAKRGCGLSGRDWTSGWNCTAMNHG